jgi:chromosome segregation ATPase
VTAVDLDALEEEIAATLAGLHARRAVLSLDVFAGDTSAERELAELHDEIGRHKLRFELAGLARDERARRDAEAAEETARVEREKADADVDRAVARREKALKTLQAELQRVGEALRAFVDAEEKLQNASVRAERRFVSARETAAELIIISARDAGLGEPLPYIRASVRSLLLAKYPPKPPKPVTVERCSVCADARRTEVEAAIANGMSLRDVGERFSLSRSALHRHSQHRVSP